MVMRHQEREWFGDHCVSSDKYQPLPETGQPWSFYAHICVLYTLGGFMGAEVPVCPVISLYCIENQTLGAPPASVGPGLAPPVRTILSCSVPSASTREKFR